MTVKYQISDKRGDAILVVVAEADTVEQAESQFAAAVALGGLGTAYENFGATVAGIPSITQLTQPQPQPEPWGQPPVPQFQPQQQYAPQVPAAAQAQPAAQVPVCQHGPKQRKEGVGAKGPWAFWGCTARSDDPTKCEKEWIR